MSISPALKNNKPWPDYSNLIERIHFDRETGHIWLDESQMLLLDATFFSDMRKVMVETLGMEGARAVLTRIGYLGGYKMADLARKMHPTKPDSEAFVIGPQLTMITGMAAVKLLELDMDIDSGKFHGEFEILSSYESDSFIKEFGHSDDPVCWHLVGFASGYSSHFMGREIIYREVECRATHDDHRCVVVGKPAEEWEGYQNDQRYFKPLNIQEEMQNLQDCIVGLKQKIESEQDSAISCGTIGSSERFKHAWTMMEKAAESQVTVLILGETGVGKEVFARGLHQCSDRADKTFVAINCAAIPASLIESELFGVEAEAYTGASKSRPGHFERADGGTLFLDEVGELSLQAQASLLRVLQESEVVRVGGGEVRKVDTRLVAATNEDLETAVAEGRFRADLYYRLNIYPVTIPPLRERVEDIPLLADHFLKKYSAQYGKRLKGISDKAMLMLNYHQWPGNVRELENMIERGVILADNNGLIGVPHLFASSDVPPSAAARERNREQQRKVANSISNEDWASDLVDSGIGMEAVESALINKAMCKANGNVARAARLLGLSRPALAYRLKRGGTHGDGASED
ncbi:sigma-54-dependent Fis family transcriptional regulator [uncultured Neptuniibacter sp.]|uniref:sigma-54-dependent Fis family transcriptional regulator n=1 Tax=uncultured Neptuniibacter sp. TaxID=502143 RepID=UPI002628F6B1|nr:sigma-54-dependent Fis family transcriptional regulator [uncultured Neptuniibacter sp.]